MLQRRISLLRLVRGTPMSKLMELGFDSNIVNFSGNCKGGGREHR